MQINFETTNAFNQHFITYYEYIIVLIAKLNTRSLIFLNYHKFLPSSLFITHKQTRVVRSSRNDAHDRGYSRGRFLTKHENSCERFVEKENYPKVFSLWRRQLKLDNSTELQRLVTRVSSRKHNYRKMKSTFREGKGTGRPKGGWYGEREMEREREREEGGTSRGTVSGAIIISKERRDRGLPFCCSLFFSTPFPLRPPSIQTRATLLSDADFATGSEARASTGSH